jgi:elongation factor Tu
MALEALTENPQIKDGENKWVDKIYALMGQVDTYIPTPKRDTENHFNGRRGCLLDNRSWYSGHWTCGAGAVKVGETVEVVGLESTRSTTVTGLEMFQKRSMKASRVIMSAFCCEEFKK